MELAEEKWVERSTLGHWPVVTRLRGKWERETSELGGPGQVRNDGLGHGARTKCIRMRVLNGMHKS